jgi:hypothetical protein
VSSVNLSNFPGGTASQLAVANDGKVIIRSANQVYSLLDGTFSPLQFPSAIGIDMSPDGSRATMGDASESPLSFYDSSTGTVQPTTAIQYYSPGSLSRTATKFVSGQFVRNADFSLFGELRDGNDVIFGDTLAPNGERVYTFNYSPVQVKVFDVRVASPTLPVTSTITPTVNPGAVRMRVSLDSRTLFILGESQFIVQPVP